MAPGRDFLLRDLSLRGRGDVPGGRVHGGVGVGGAEDAFVAMGAREPEESGGRATPKPQLLEQKPDRPREILPCATRRPQTVRKRKPGRSARNDDFCLVLVPRKASQAAAAANNRSTFESRSRAIFRASGLSYGARKLAIVS